MTIDKMRRVLSILISNSNEKIEICNNYKRNIYMSDDLSFNQPNDIVILIFEYQFYGNFTFEFSV